MIGAFFAGSVLGLLFGFALAAVALHPWPRRDVRHVSVREWGYVRGSDVAGWRPSRDCAEGMLPGESLVKPEGE